MKYYEITRKTNINGIVPPGLNGKNVKNKEDFFDNDKCGPDRFYDKLYEFDYLVPIEFGDGRQDKPSKAIYDYHLWFGEEPWGGWFAPVSNCFKKVLEKFNLGEHRFYPAWVLFKKQRHEYSVLQLLYNSYEKYIDFDLTVFNNLDSFRDIEGRQFTTKPFLSVQEVKHYAKANWGSGVNWNYERIVMKPEFRDIDFVTFFKFGDIVSERLKNTIEEAGLTGIEFKELPIPIEFSDEI